MALNVTKELAALERQTVDELRARYAEVFGEQTRSRHRVWLIQRVIWRLQSLEEGDLSERARRRALELANDADLRVSAPRGPTRSGMGRTTTRPFPASDRLPMPGAMLTRKYRGRTIKVVVLPNGFEFEGQVYRSLSAVAKVVTGAHWNGYHFFGLKRKEVAA